MGGGGGGGGGGVISFIEQFRDVSLEQVYFSCLGLYDKVSILSHNYINNPCF